MFLDWLSFVCFILLFAIPLFLLYKFSTQPNNSFYPTPFPSPIELPVQTEIESVTSTNPTTRTFATHIGTKKAKRLEQKARRREYNQWVRQQRDAQQEHQDLYWEHEQECRKVEQQELHEEYLEIKQQNEKLKIAMQKEREKRDRAKDAIISRIVAVVEEESRKKKVILFSCEKLKREYKINNEEMVMKYIEDVVTRYNSKHDNCKCYFVSLDCKSMCAIYFDSAIDYLYEVIQESSNPIPISDLYSMVS